MYYYFSVEDWNGRRGEHRLPIRTIMIRLHLNHTDHFSTTYMDYSDFHAVDNHTTDNDGRDGIWHVPGSCLAVYKPINLPKLPMEFDIDADISANHTTFHFREFYDYKNNRARFEYNIGGNTTTDIYLVDEKHHFTIKNGKCEVKKISSNDSLVNDGNLKSVNSVLRFGDDYDEKYMGLHTVRNIECDRWWINFTRGSHFYVVNYYFSVENWVIDRYGKHRVPIRVEFERYPILPGHVHAVNYPDFWLYFDYIRFHTSPPDDFVYLTPAICLEESHTAFDAGLTLGISTLSGGAGVVGGVVGGVIFGFFLVFLMSFLSKMQGSFVSSNDVDLKDTSIQQDDF
jgi:hypothetical protein